MHSYAILYNSTACFPSWGEAKRIILIVPVVVGTAKSCLCPHPTLKLQKNGTLPSNVFIIMMQLTKVHLRSEESNYCPHPLLRVSENVLPSNQLWDNHNGTALPSLLIISVTPRKSYFLKPAVCHKKAIFVVSHYSWHYFILSAFVIPNSCIFGDTVKTIHSTFLGMRWAGSHMKCCKSFHSWAARPTYFRKTGRG